MARLLLGVDASLLDRQVAAGWATRTPTHSKFELACESKISIVPHRRKGDRPVPHRFEPLDRANVRRPGPPGVRSGPPGGRAGLPGFRAGPYRRLTRPGRRVAGLESRSAGPGCRVAGPHHAPPVGFPIAVGPPGRAGCRRAPCAVRRLRGGPGL